MQTLQRVWDGVVEDDTFNALVVRAGLTWWQANVLRAYAQYLRQAGLTFTPEHIAATLVDYPDHARALVQLFEAKFHPDLSGAESAQTTSDAEAAIARSMQTLASYDQDVILGALRNCIDATLRTNAYREDDGQRRTAVAFKLRSAEVDTLPHPRPWSEIWVHSPRMEGIHLRFGAVSRGGLRWSDRLEDFRTEVLGLVKAQQVKNAVIVPLGAKGGFVVKPVHGRTDPPTAGLDAYRTFVASLLDVTDNVIRTHDAKGGQTEEVVRPPRTRCYDDADPYLVVAADKGTATFSDEANSVSRRYGFWLDDAFASGGSAGFDHKAMGITARGAWESVRAHFHALGVDVSHDSFTAIGIGDMSGDVFGNGMLLSRSLRLVAAFDHRNIFLDPHPDAARSFEERKRLFATPGSSWADYDPALISPGGGVYPRSGRSVPISPQVAQALGIDPAKNSVSPAEMIRHILRAPADLLWNGGVGTFVKSSQEPDCDAGDWANDDVRVDACELRVRVVGEGGNLGLTPRARIEFALHGGKVNSDALDNSAGVDTSDHEVNLKILLDLAIGRGQFDPALRTGLLASCEEGVARRVLRHTRDQNTLVAVETSLSPSMAPVHERFLGELETSFGLDRTVECLPATAELTRRQSAGGGLTAPENAVLCAYSKLWLRASLLASTLPLESWVEGRLRTYFPSAAAQACMTVVPDHPLRREIVSTVLANEIVNQAGATFTFRATQETGASAERVVRAYVAAWTTFGLDALIRDLEAAGLPAGANLRARLEVRRFIDRTTRWFLTFGEPDADPLAEAGTYGGIIAAIAPQLPGLLRDRDASNLTQDVAELLHEGIPADLANRLALLLHEFQLLDVAKVALHSRLDADDVADVRFALSERLRLDDLLIAIGELPHGTRWDAIARGGLRHDLYSAASAITAQIVATCNGADVAARRSGWNDALSLAEKGFDTTIDQILAPGERSFAALFSAVRTLQTLRLRTV
jgi:glutamate dehydrogenase